MATLEVFCDGSLTNAVLTDVFESALGDEYVGRAIVLVPSVDVGFVGQLREGMVSAEGNPLSREAEAFSVRAAIDLCARQGITDFVVYNDCLGMADRFPDAQVEWRRREELAHSTVFFDKIIHRAGYLRRSAGVKRRPARPHHLEIFLLFNSPALEFRLSESALWQNVCERVGPWPSP